MCDGEADRLRSVVISAGVPCHDTNQPPRRRQNADKLRELAKSSQHSAMVAPRRAAEPSAQRRLHDRREAATIGLRKRHPRASSGEASRELSGATSSLKHSAGRGHLTQEPCDRPCEPAARDTLTCRHEEHRRPPLRCSSRRAESLPLSNRGLQFCNARGHLEAHQPVATNACGE